MTAPLTARGAAALDARLMRAATYASVAVGSALLLIKLAGFIATGSVALLSTLVDSTLDAAASVINLLAVRQALTPADREHRFGHGKAEPLAGLGQSAFVVGSALFLIGQAAQRLVTPEPVEHTGFGMAVMAASIALSVVLLWFQRLVLKRAASLAIRADALHYAGDLALSAAVMVALFLDDRFGWRLADPLFAIAIALVLVWGAWRIAHSSLDLLMDRELGEPERQRIVTLCRTHPEVLGVHDLRTRSAGQQSFIQLHLELDPALTLARAHIISDEVEAKITAAFPAAEVIIHEDPAGVPEAHPEFR